MMIETTIKRICVFCGSQTGAREVYGEQARALGRALAERGIGLVYGGGGIGMMGAVADAVIEARGEVIGVIAYALASKERARRDVDIRVVNAMPGGFGTFEEMMETITWGQLGIHQKPVGLLNVASYYDPLLAMIDRAVEEGFILPRYRNLFIASSGIDELFDLMRKFQPLEGLVKWIEMSET